MKTIKVAAAIIKKDNKILIASRKTGEFAGMFEFPGGKVEPGETSKQALIREIQEELETSINIDEFFMNVNYTYPTFILDMDCFICSLKDEQITLNVHDSIKWRRFLSIKVFLLPYRYRKKTDSSKLSQKDDADII